MSKYNRYLKILLFAVAILFIVIGFFRGELNDVWKKSTNICLECIGIG